MNIFGHLHELQTYQQYKMVAILIAILDFVHFLVLEFVNNHFNRFPVPWNTCLDTVFCYWQVCTQIYDKNVKTAAILAAILDFIHMLVLKPLDYHFFRFSVSLNICLDT